MKKPPKRSSPRPAPTDTTRKPPPPRTDDPALDKSEIKDGVLQPLPAAD